MEFSSLIRTKHKFQCQIRPHLTSLIRTAPSVSWMKLLLLPAQHMHDVKSLDTSRIFPKCYEYICQAYFFISIIPIADKIFKTSK